MRKSDGQLPPGSRVFGYARDSGGAGQERSVGQQAAEIRATCAAHQWELAGLFTDEAKSGGSDVGRAGLAALLEAAQKGKGQGVVFWSSSRFARDVDDAQYFRSTLRKRGYQLVYLSDPVPDAGSFTPLLETVKDITNQQYLENLSRDVRRGLDARRSQGWADGPVPLGYRVERFPAGTDRDGNERMGSRWVVDEETAPRVRQAWRMRAEGRTLRDIHRVTQLYPSGVLASYQKLFKTKVHLGILRRGGREYQIAEPLITRATYDRVRARQKAHPRRASSPYLLSGLLVCGVCGRLMNGCGGRNEQGRLYRYYRCEGYYGHDGAEPHTNKVRVEPVEWAVFERVTGKFTPEWAGKAAAQWRKRRAGAGKRRAAELARLKEKLAALDGAIARLLDSIEAGASVGSRLAERERERAALAGEIAELEAAPAAEPDPGEMLEAAAALRAAYAAGDANAGRAALARLLVSVTLTPPDILEFTWRE